MDKYLISIMIVVREAEGYIERSIMSIINQNICKDDYEIIIVDGNSKDNTVCLAQNVLKDNNINHKIINNEKKTLAYGWNIGIRAAEGRYIVRPDAHSELLDKYIEVGISKLSGRTELAGVGGVLYNKADSFISTLIGKVLSNPIGVGISAFRIGVKEDTITDTAVYAVYKKEIFDKVGLFNEDLARNQDIEFHKRIQEAGYKVMTSPGMKAIYYNRTSILKLLQQGFQNGFWVTYSEGGHLRHKVPLLFLLILLIGIFVDIFVTEYFLIFYAGVVLSAYLGKSNVYNPLKLIILFLLTFCLHIAYGCGSFIGVIKKIL